jgi:hypothetical protein
MPSCSAWWSGHRIGALAKLSDGSFVQINDAVVQLTVQRVAGQSGMTGSTSVASCASDSCQPR